ncbi:hypothetical protein ETSB_0937 [cyanobacterium endosymbiont of Epithemia turgida isolate EtSB Lake Yunoko]|nr:hypothetical protein ETSB_0937 [cyanobacterium endosymbiont of Epithemia turgida isolate EtSB Lake Yunoko]
MKLAFWSYFCQVIPHITLATATMISLTTYLICAALRVIPYGLFNRRE